MQLGVSSYAHCSHRSRSRASGWCQTVGRSSQEPVTWILGITLMKEASVWNALWENYNTSDLQWTVMWDGSFLAYLQTWITITSPNAISSSVF